MKVPCVYILASKRDGVLYIGVTSDIAHRMVEHSQGFISGFTRTYAVKSLVYYEMHHTMDEAIKREAPQGMAPGVEGPVDRIDESGVAQFVRS